MTETELQIYAQAIKQIEQIRLFREALDKAMKDKAILKYAKIALYNYNVDCMSEIVVAAAPLENFLAAETIRLRKMLTDAGITQ